MSYLGQQYNVVPTPGGFMAGSPPRRDGRDSSSASDDAERPLDKRVKWAKKMAGTLYREKSECSEEMQRNNGLYDGDKPWWKNRPKWKIGASLNYCHWVPTTWAAVLADNKPKVAFSAFRREDQKQADIMGAAWNDCYHRNGWQQVLHDAILMSRIEKKAFLRLTFDPLANHGDGDAVLKAVSGMQVYANANATSVRDAEVLMFEEQQSMGAILSRYPHLKDKLKPEPREGERTDEDGEQNLPPASFAGMQAGSLSPGQNSTTVGATKHAAPYNAPENAPGARGSHGMLVREFWTRPKGPSAMTEVDSIRFNAGNEPACKRKIMEFEDDEGNITREPLQTVVTEGNIMYELPMSQVELLQFAGDMLGGVRVLETYEAWEVLTEKKSVPLYPSGRRMVVIGEHVADDGMNPFSHGMFPFIGIDAYRNPKKMFGMSDIDIIYDLQEYVVRLFSLFLDAAILTSNPIWRLPLSSEMSDEDITNAPGAVQREDVNSLKYGKREPGPDMPQYLFQILQFAIAQIRDLSGLTEVATGGKFKGQQAAETVSMYQESAGVRFRDALHNVEQAIEELGQQFMGVVSQFYTTPRIAMIKNHMNGDEESTAYFGSALSAPMRIEAKSGSMLPTSPSARLNYMMQLLNGPKPVIDLHEIWSLLAEVGLIDSATAIERRIERELKNPAEAWKVIGLPAPQGGKNTKGSPKKKPGSIRSQSAKK